MRKKPKYITEHGAMQEFPVLQTCFVPFEAQELVPKIRLKQKVRKN